jgi:hypothetical protein
VADPETGEVTQELKNSFEKVVAEPEDVEGVYSVITLNGGKPNEVKVLLDRNKPGEPWETPFRKPDGSYHVVAPSQLDPTGLVPSFCSHGLELHPATGLRPHGGASWVRSRFLTIEPGLPPKVMCHCEHVAGGRCDGAETCPKELWPDA